MDAGNNDINAEEQGGDSGKLQNDRCTDGLESSSELIQSQKLLEVVQRNNVLVDQTTPALLISEF